ncbi:3-hydroxyacyl-CoA dehydrogenase type-2 [Penicillium subrubescens]|uniref:3-hydroxyacyl-CoA dehydrogenase type-2 n=1 Tax=Penicillium subrubescens TaxID=1316194 RepID=A0A1Q5T8K2_9EURO|nr:3-hydroxyacyl-CoA dehydrogenase type-2 [Penicillium subrubescens]
MNIGGADGFGAAIVDRFSREGWKVIMIDLNKSGGEAKARADPNLEYVFGDVSKQETWETALGIIRNKYGRVDVIVNNAGITHDPSVWAYRNDTPYNL